MSDSMQRANAEREKAMQRASQAENATKTQPDDQSVGSGDVIQLEKELVKARAELARVNRNWERRFTVLRASLHEIKDEAYIRKRIEALPMSLHTAKVVIFVAESLIHFIRLNIETRARMQTTQTSPFAMVA